MPWKHRPVQGPPQCVPCSLKSLCPVGLGKIFGRELQPRCWCGYRKWVATDVKTRHLRIVWNLHVPWPMAAGIGEAFSKPFLASVFASRPSCLYLNWRQKVYPKLKPFLASDFSLLAGSLAPCTMHKATNIFVETLYSVFACACKQAELIGLPPVNWTTDRLRYICFCFWDARRTQGGYWNWSAILETFCEADCGVGIRCNGCGPMNASVAGIYCFGSLFWEALGNLAPKILKLVSGQVAVIFTFQWQWYFPAGPAVADALVCLSFGVARLPAPGLFEFCLRWLVAAWQPSRIGNDCVWVFAWCHSSSHLQILVIHDGLNVLSLRPSAEWPDD